MKAVAVYCGASPGASPRYADAARVLARELVGRDLALVYGGGNVGLMGVIADEVLRLGGRVFGVIPRGLFYKEIAHGGLTELFVVADMHERKAKMAQLADAFIALPGGMGTLEELFEMLTWSQLGIHAKPVGVFNVDGFFDLLVGFVAHLQEQGFLRPQHAALMMVDADAGNLLGRLDGAA